MFPDIKDRTPNDPSVLISPAKILKLYNTSHKTIYRINDAVKNWFYSFAVNQGWKVRFTGNQAILTAEVILNES